MIEDLAWSSDVSFIKILFKGSVLLASTYKKFILMIKYKDEVFGKALTKQEMIYYKENNYGA